MKQARSYKTLSILGTSLFCVALLGGCATTEELNAVKATADQASQKADQANATANAAKSAASQAASQAASAQATAGEAKATADAAKATADAAKAESASTSEKVDRMFKKTMQK